MNNAASAIRLSSPIDLRDLSRHYSASGGDGNSAVPTMAARIRIGLVRVRVRTNS
jgi:hypothetical protein